MNGITARLRAWWETADRTQRLISMGGIAALLMFLAGTFYFASRPKYAILFSGLSEQDEGDVASAVQSMGFTPQFGQAGTISVPSSDVRQIRAKLAEQNKLPKGSDQWGLSELKDNPLGMSPGVERARLKAVLEGEIAKTIGYFDGIEEARVNITIPNSTPFADQRQDPSASIAVIESSAQTSPNMGRAIATLVAGAVDGLQLKNVVVVNQQGEFLFNGPEEAGGPDADADKTIELDRSVSESWRRDIQSILDGVYGPGATIVSVHAELDMDPSHVSSSEQTPSRKPTVQESTSETMSGTGVGAPGGPAGMVANTGAPATPGAGGNGTGYNGQSTSTQYAITQTQTDTTKAVGTLRSLAINVVANSNKIKTPADVANLKSIVAGEIKNHPDATQFTTQVSAVPFDQTASALAKKEASSATMQARIRQILAMLPMVALLIVAFMVIRSIGKVGKSFTPPTLALPGAGSQPRLPGGTSGMSALPGTEIGPDGLLAALAVAEDEHASEQVVRKKKKRSEMTEEEIDIEDIKNRVHMPLEQLKKMADERPGVVAQLIKSMMLEEN